MSGLEHYGAVLYDIDMRIARLAIACGVDLTKRTNVTGIIRGDHLDYRASTGQMWRELRSLLVFKHQVEVHCEADLGIDECMEILHAEEEQVRQHGLPLLGTG
jgi:hypothetical protein